MEKAKIKKPQDLKDYQTYPHSSRMTFSRQLV